MLTPQKIGLIAGQGDLPVALLQKWQSMGVTPVVVGLHGTTPENILHDQISAVYSIGQAGHILDFFKSHGVQKIVMAGGLKRPNFWTILSTLRTDKTGFQIILKLLCRRMGDDSLLKIIRHEIETRGLQVAGAHEFLPEILCPVGVLGKIQPTEDDFQKIQNGFIKAKSHGATDKGQSVVMGDNGQIAYETETGTNALIKSCAGWNEAILIKTSKPQQDLSLDMPTIGIGTIDVAHVSGFKGIAIEAGKTIILDRDKVIELCNEYRIFVVGIEDK